MRLLVYAASEPQAHAAARAAYDRVNELDAIMSDYTRDSELMRLCARSGEGPVNVSADLFGVLDYAQEVSRRSAGAFDVTVGPLVALWRQARKTGELPDDGALAEAKSRVGWQLIKLDRKRHAVELIKPGMKLDLGGIAKGYAGDEAIRVLKQHGIRSALFEAGGDIVVSNAPPGAKGWTIELATGGTIKLKDMAISTSGDTAQYVEINGRRYSHVVDPQTGLGLSEHFIATVIARRGMATDALSTAATIVGPERGHRLIKAFGARGWIGKS